MFLDEEPKYAVFTIEKIAVAFANAAEKAGHKTMLLVKFCGDGEKLFVVRRVDPLDIN